MSVYTMLFYFICYLSRVKKTNERVNFGDLGWDDGAGDEEQGEEVCAGYGDG